MEIRVRRFQNYRDCGYTWNPHKFEIPALWFSRRVPVNPCKHLQCSHSIQVSFFQNVVHPVGLFNPVGFVNPIGLVSPIGFFNPVGFVNPVGLVSLEICKLSRSTNLALNFPAILNLSKIFQIPNHASLQVLCCLNWFTMNGFFLNIQLQLYMSSSFFITFII